MNAVGYDTKNTKPIQTRKSSFSELTNNTPPINIVSRKNRPITLETWSKNLDSIRRVLYRMSDDVKTKNKLAKKLRHLHHSRSSLYLNSNDVLKSPSVIYNFMNQCYLKDCKGTQGQGRLPQTVTTAFEEETSDAAQENAENSTKYLANIRTQSPEYRNDREEFNTHNHLMAVTYESSFDRKSSEMEKQSRHNSKINGKFSVENYVCKPVKMHLKDNSQSHKQSESINPCFITPISAMQSRLTKNNEYISSQNVHCSESQRSILPILADTALHKDTEHECVSDQYPINPAKEKHSITERLCKQPVDPKKLATNVMRVRHADDCYIERAVCGQISKEEQHSKPNSNCAKTFPCGKDSTVLLKCYDDRNANAANTCAKSNNVKLAINCPSAFSELTYRSPLTSSFAKKHEPMKLKTWSKNLDNIRHVLYLASDNVKTKNTLAKRLRHFHHSRSSLYLNSNDILKSPSVIYNFMNQCYLKDYDKQNNRMSQSGVQIFEKDVAQVNVQGSKRYFENISKRLPEHAETREHTETKKHADPQYHMVQDTSVSRLESKPDHKKKQTRPTSKTEGKFRLDKVVGEPVYGQSKDETKSHSHGGSAKIFSRTSTTPAVLLRPEENYKNFDSQKAVQPLTMADTTLHKNKKDKIISNQQRNYSKIRKHSVTEECFESTMYTESQKLSRPILAADSVLPKNKKGKFISKASYQKRSNLKRGTHSKTEKSSKKLEDISYPHSQKSVQQPIVAETVLRQYNNHEYKSDEKKSYLEKQRHSTTEKLSKQFDDLNILTKNLVEMEPIYTYTTESEDHRQHGKQEKHTDNTTICEKHKNSVSKGNFKKHNENKSSLFNKHVKPSTEIESISATATLELVEPTERGTVSIHILDSKQQGDILPACSTIYKYPYDIPTIDIQNTKSLSVKQKTKVSKGSTDNEYLSIPKPKKKAVQLEPEKETRPPYIGPKEKEFVMQSNQQVIHEQPKFVNILADQYSADGVVNALVNDVPVQSVIFVNDLPGEQKKYHIEYDSKFANSFPVQQQTNSSLGTTRTEPKATADTSQYLNSNTVYSKPFTTKPSHAKYLSLQDSHQYEPIVFAYTPPYDQHCSRISFAKTIAEYLNEEEEAKLILTDVPMESAVITESSMCDPHMLANELRTDNRVVFTTHEKVTIPFIRLSAIYEVSEKGDITEDKRKLTSNIKECPTNMLSDVYEVEQENDSIDRRQQVKQADMTKNVQTLIDTRQEHEQMKKLQRSVTSDKNSKVSDLLQNKQTKSVGSISHTFKARDHTNKSSQHKTREKIVANTDQGNVKKAKISKKSTTRKTADSEYDYYYEYYTVYGDSTVLNVDDPLNVKNKINQPSDKTLRYPEQKTPEEKTNFLMTILYGILGRSKTKKQNETINSTKKKKKTNKRLEDKTMFNIHSDILDDISLEKTKPKVNKEEKTLFGFHSDIFDDEKTFLKKGDDKTLLGFNSSIFNTPICNKLIVPKIENEEKTSLAVDSQVFGDATHDIHSFVLPDDKPVVGNDTKLKNGATIKKTAFALSHITELPEATQLKNITKPFTEKDKAKDEEYYYSYYYYPPSTNNTLKGCETFASHICDEAPLKLKQVSETKDHKVIHNNTDCLQVTSEKPSSHDEKQSALKQALPSLPSVNEKFYSNKTARTSTGSKPQKKRNSKKNSDFQLHVEESEEHIYTEIDDILIENKPTSNAEIKNSQGYISKALKLSKRHKVSDVTKEFFSETGDHKPSHENVVFKSNEKKQTNSKEDYTYYTYYDYPTDHTLKGIKDFTSCVASSLAIKIDSTAKSNILLVNATNLKQNKNLENLEKANYTAYTRAYNTRLTDLNKDNTEKSQTESISRLGMEKKSQGSIKAGICLNQLFQKSTPKSKHKLRRLSRLSNTDKFSQVKCHTKSAKSSTVMVEPVTARRSSTARNINNIISSHNKKKNVVNVASNKVFAAKDPNVQDVSSKQENTKNSLITAYNRSSHVESQLDGSPKTIDIDEQLEFLSTEYNTRAISTAMPSKIKRRTHVEKNTHDRVSNIERSGSEKNKDDSYLYYSYYVTSTDNTLQGCEEIESFIADFIPAYPESSSIQRVCTNIENDIKVSNITVLSNVPACPQTPISHKSIPFETLGVMTNDEMKKVYKQQLLSAGELSVADVLDKCKDDQTSDDFKTQMFIKDKTLNPTNETHSFDYISNLFSKTLYDSKAGIKTFYAPIPKIIPSLNDRYIKKQKICEPSENNLLENELIVSEANFFKDNVKQLTENSPLTPLQHTRPENVVSGFNEVPTKNPEVSRKDSYSYYYSYYPTDADDTFNDCKNFTSLITDSSHPKIIGNNTALPDTIFEQPDVQALLEYPSIHDEKNVVDKIEDKTRENAKMTESLTVVLSENKNIHKDKIINDETYANDKTVVTKNLSKRFPMQNTIGTNSKTNYLENKQSYKNIKQLPKIPEEKTAIVVSTKHINCEPNTPEKNDKNTKVAEDNQLHKNVNPLKPHLEQQFENVSLLKFQNTHTGNVLSGDKNVPAKNSKMSNKDGLYSYYYSYYPTRTDDTFNDVKKFSSLVTDKSHSKINVNEAVPNTKFEEANVNAILDFPSTSIEKIDNNKVKFRNETRENVILTEGFKDMLLDSKNNPSVNIENVVTNTSPKMDVNITISPDVPLQHLSKHYKNIENKSGLDLHTKKLEEIIIDTPEKVEQLKKIEKINQLNENISPSKTNVKIDSQSGLSVPCQNTPPYNVFSGFKEVPIKNPETSKKKSAYSYYYSYYPTNKDDTFNDCKNFSSLVTDEGLCKINVTEKTVPNTVIEEPNVNTILEFANTASGKYLDNKVEFEGKTRDSGKLTKTLYDIPAENKKNNQEITAGVITNRSATMDANNTISPYNAIQNKLKTDLILSNLENKESKKNVTNPLKNYDDNSKLGSITKNPGIKTNTREQTENITKNRQLYKKENSLKDDEEQQCANVTSLQFRNTHADNIVSDFIDARDKNLKTLKKDGPYTYCYSYYPTAADDTFNDCKNFTSLITDNSPCEINIDKAALINTTYEKPDVTANSNFVSTLTKKNWDNTVNYEKENKQNENVTEMLNEISAPNKKRNEDLIANAAADTNTKNDAYKKLSPNSSLRSKIQTDSKVSRLNKKWNKTNAKKLGNICEDNTMFDFNPNILNIKANTCHPGEKITVDKKLNKKLNDAKYKNVILKINDKKPTNYQKRKIDEATSLEVSSNILDDHYIYKTENNTHNEKHNIYPASDKNPLEIVQIVRGGDGETQNKQPENVFVENEKVNLKKPEVSKKVSSYVYYYSYYPTAVDDTFNDCKNFTSLVTDPTLSKINRNGTALPNAKMEKTDGSVILDVPRSCKNDNMDKYVTVEEQTLKNVSLKEILHPSPSTHEKNNEELIANSKNDIKARENASTEIAPNVLSKNKKPTHVIENYLENKHSKNNVKKPHKYHKEKTTFGFNTNVLDSKTNTPKKDYKLAEHREIEKKLDDVKCKKLMLKNNEKKESKNKKRKIDEATTFGVNSNILDISCCSKISSNKNTDRNNKYKEILELEKPKKAKDKRKRLEERTTFGFQNSILDEPEQKSDKQREEKTWFGVTSNILDEYGNTKVSESTTSCFDKKIIIHADIKETKGENSVHRQAEIVRSNPEHNMYKDAEIKQNDKEENISKSNKEQIKNLTNKTNNKIEEVPKKIPHDIHSVQQKEKNIKYNPRYKKSRDFDAQTNDEHIDRILYEHYNNKNKHGNKNKIGGKTRTTSKIISINTVDLSTDQLNTARNGEEISNKARNRPCNVDNKKMNTRCHNKIPRYGQIQRKYIHLLPNVMTPNTTKVSKSTIITDKQNNESKRETLNHKKNNEPKHILTSFFNQDNKTEGNAVGEITFHSNRNKHHAKRHKQCKTQNSAEKVFTQMKVDDVPELSQLYVPTETGKRFSTNRNASKNFKNAAWDKVDYNTATRRSTHYVDRKNSKPNWNRGKLCPYYKTSSKETLGESLARILLSPYDESIHANIWRNGDHAFSNNNSSDSVLKPKHAGECFFGRLVQVNTNTIGRRKRETRPKYNYYKTTSLSREDTYEKKTNAVPCNCKINNENEVSAYVIMDPCPSERNNNSNSYLNDYSDLENKQKPLEKYKETSRLYSTNRVNSGIKIPKKALKHDSKHFETLKVGRLKTLKNKIQPELATYIEQKSLLHCGLLNASVCPQQVNQVCDNYTVTQRSSVKDLVAQIEQKIGIDAQRGLEAAMVISPSTKNILAEKEIENGDLPTTKLDKIFTGSTTESSYDYSLLHSKSTNPDKEKRKYLTKQKGESIFQDSGAVCEDQSYHHATNSQITKSFPELKSRTDDKKEARSTYSSEKSTACSAQSSLHYIDSQSKPADNYSFKTHYPGSYDWSSQNFSRSTTVKTRAKKKFTKKEKIITDSDKSTKYGQSNTLTNIKQGNEDLHEIYADKASLQFSTKSSYSYCDYDGGSKSTTTTTNKNLLFEEPKFVLDNLYMEGQTITKSLTHSKANTGCDAHTDIKPKHVSDKKQDKILRKSSKRAASKVNQSAVVKLNSDYTYTYSIPIDQQTSFSTVMDLRTEATPVDQLDSVLKENRDKRTSTGVFSAEARQRTISTYMHSTAQKLSKNKTTKNSSSGSSKNITVVKKKVNQSSLSTSNISSEDEQTKNDYSYYEYPTDNKTIDTTMSPLPSFEVIPTDNLLEDGGNRGSRVSSKKSIVSITRENEENRFIVREINQPEETAAKSAIPGGAYHGFPADHRTVQTDMPVLSSFDARALENFRSLANTKCQEGNYNSTAVIDEHDKYTKKSFTEHGCTEQDSEKDKSKSQYSYYYGYPTDHRTIQTIMTPLPSFEIAPARNINDEVNRNDQETTKKLAISKLEQESDIHDRAEQTENDQQSSRDAESKSQYSYYYGYPTDHRTIQTVMTLLPSFEVAPLLNKKSSVDKNVRRTDINDKSFKYTQGQEENSEGSSIVNKMFTTKNNDSTTKPNSDYSYYYGYPTDNRTMQTIMTPVPSFEIAPSESVKLSAAKTDKEITRKFDIQQVDKDTQDSYLEAEINKRDSKHTVSESQYSYYYGYPTDHRTIQTNMTPLPSFEVAPLLNRASSVNRGFPKAKTVEQNSFLTVEQNKKDKPYLIEQETIKPTVQNKFGPTRTSNEYSYYYGYPTDHKTIETVMTSLPLCEIAPTEQSVNKNDKKSRSILDISKVEEEKGKRYPTDHRTVQTIMTSLPSYEIAPFLNKAPLVKERCQRVETVGDKAKEYAKKQEKKFENTSILHEIIPAKTNPSKTPTINDYSYYYGYPTDNRTIQTEMTPLHSFEIAPTEDSKLSIATNNKATRGEFSVSEAEQEKKTIDRYMASQNSEKTSKDTKSKSQYSYYYGYPTDHRTIQTNMTPLPSFEIASLSNKASLHNRNSKVLESINNKTKKYIKEFEKGGRRNSTVDKILPASNSQSNMQASNEYSYYYGYPTDNRTIQTIMTPLPSFEIAPIENLQYLIVKNKQAASRIVNRVNRDPKRLTQDTCLETEITRDSTDPKTKSQYSYYYGYPTDNRTIQTVMTPLPSFEIAPKENLKLSADNNEQGCGRIPNVLKVKQERQTQKSCVEHENDKRYTNDPHTKSQYSYYYGYPTDNRTIQTVMTPLPSYEIAQPVNLKLYLHNKDQSARRQNVLKVERETGKQDSLLAGESNKMKSTDHNAESEYVYYYTYPTNTKTLQTGVKSLPLLEVKPLSAKHEIAKPKSSVFNELVQNSTCKNDETQSQYSYSYQYPSDNRTIQTHKTPMPSFEAVALAKTYKETQQNGRKIKEVFNVMKPTDKCNPIIVSGTALYITPHVDTEYKSIEKKCVNPDLLKSREFCPQNRPSTQTFKKNTFLINDKTLRSSFEDLPSFEIASADVHNNSEENKGLIRQKENISSQTHAENTPIQNNYIHGNLVKVPNVVSQIQSKIQEFNEAAAGTTNQTLISRADEFPDFYIDLSDIHKNSGDSKVRGHGVMSQTNYECQTLGPAIKNGQRMARANKVQHCRDDQTLTDSMGVPTCEVSPSKYSDNGRLKHYKDIYQKDNDIEKCDKRVNEVNQLTALFTNQFLSPESVYYSSPLASNTRQNSNEFKQHPQTVTSPKMLEKNKLNVYSDYDKTVDDSVSSLPSYEFAPVSNIAEKEGNDYCDIGYKFGVGVKLKSGKMPDNYRPNLTKPNLSTITEHYTDEKSKHTLSAQNNTPKNTQLCEKMISDNKYEDLQRVECIKFPENPYAKVKKSKIDEDKTIRDSMMSLPAFEINPIFENVHHSQKYSELDYIDTNKVKQQQENESRLCQEETFHKNMPEIRLTTPSEKSLLTEIQQKQSSQLPHCTNEFVGKNKYPRPETSECLPDEACSKIFVKGETDIEQLQSSTITSNPLMIISKSRDDDVFGSNTPHGYISNTGFESTKHIQLCRNCNLTPTASSDSNKDVFTDSTKTEFVVKVIEKTDATSTNPGLAVIEKTKNIDKKISLSDKTCSDIVSCSCADKINMRENSFLLYSTQDNDLSKIYANKSVINSLTHTNAGSQKSLSNSSYTTNTGYVNTLGTATISTRTKLDMNNDISDENKSDLQTSSMNAYDNNDKTANSDNIVERISATTYYSIDNLVNVTTKQKLNDESNYHSSSACGSSYTGDTSVSFERLFADVDKNYVLTEDTTLATKGMSKIGAAYSPKIYTSNTSHNSSDTSLKLIKDQSKNNAYTFIRSQPSTSQKRHKSLYYAAEIESIKPGKICNNEKSKIRKKYVAKEITNILRENENDGNIEEASTLTGDQMNISDKITTLKNLYHAQTISRSGITPDKDAFLEEMCSIKKPVITPHVIPVSNKNICNDRQRNPPNKSYKHKDVAENSEEKDNAKTCKLKNKNKVHIPATGLNCRMVESFSNGVQIREPVNRTRERKKKHLFNANNHCYVAEIKTL